MRIVSVVGARPQFVKEAPVGRALRKRHEEILIHTGQHYDSQMSDVFFAELGIPLPDHNLGIGAGPHGDQTGRMLAALEQVLVKEAPDRVLVYGDTNSTLAAALAAAKLRIPVAHVEAGLRSFDRAMPEEINRVLTDHASDILFAPTQAAVEHLATEGIQKGVHLVGDVMVDALQEAVARSRGRTGVFDELRVQPRSYVLATLHRPSNVDDGAALARILAAFARVPETIVLPLHPRSRARLTEFGLTPPANVRVTPPAGHLDFVALEMGAKRVLTDSGGVQKEAYCLGVPCVTLRDTTEWPETIEDGWNVLVGNDAEKIVEMATSFTPRSASRQRYGAGGAGERIAEIIGAREVSAPNAPRR